MTLIRQRECIWHKPAPVAQSVEYPLPRVSGGHRFHPVPLHTVFVKMVLAAPRLALRRTG